MNNYLKKYIRMLLTENDDIFFEMLLVENIEKALEKMGLTSLTLDFLNSKDLGKRQIAIANYIANEIKKGNWNPNQSEEEQALEVIDQYLDELVFMHKELNSIGVMIDLRKFKLIEDAYSYIEKEYNDKFSEIEPDDKSQEIVMKFPNGFYWIKLNKRSCEEEGKEMQHCGRGIGTNLVSLRDRMGGRHVTVDIDERTKEFFQIKGKNNAKPVKKYFPYILSLLKNENYSDYEFGRNMMFSEIDFNLIDLYNYDKKDPEIRKKIITAAENGDDYVRESLAKNPNLVKDKEIQLILAEKGDEEVRWALARNLNIDKEVQLILAEKGNNYVRGALASNPIIDKEIQLILAENGDEYVRESLARNRNIDKELQLILAKKGGNRARIYLASNPIIDKEIQLILAEEGSNEVRGALAYNPSADKEIQLILAENGDEYVRRVLAYNPNIDKEIQLILAEKGSDRIREALRSNPNLDPEIRRMLEAR